MTVADFQHDINQRRKAELEAHGFEFAINADGYEVRFKGDFVGGASVLLPRSKPLHWKHRCANLRDNLGSAVSLALRSSQANLQRTLTQ